MSLRKPFRATPVKLGAHYRRKEAYRTRKSVLGFLGASVPIGVLIGLGSVALTGEGRARLFAVATPIAVSSGAMRAREPQVGDNWGGCDDARAAGTAPIYAGEPGYREQMDGDGDGVACEPYRGG